MQRDRYWRIVIYDTRQICLIAAATVVEMLGTFRTQDNGLARCAIAVDAPLHTGDHLKVLFAPIAGMVFSAGNRAIADEVTASVGFVVVTHQ